MAEREVIIIGGGPAGLSAAIFTQFDGWSTLVLEGGWVGGQGAIAYTVSNYPGFPPGDGAVLMENMEKQVTSAPPAGVGAELRRERVISLNAEDKIVTTEVNEYKAQAVILATGSTMQRLGVTGEDKYVRKGISYYAKHDVNQFGGNHQKIGQFIGVCFAQNIQMGQILVRYLGQRDSGDVQLFLFNQAQQQIKRPLKGGQLDRVAGGLWLGIRIRAVISHNVKIIPSFLWIYDYSPAA